MNPVSLHDLAYLSGRSLSALYNTSPIKWIRNRRLDKVKELLTNTSLSVTDVCYSTGFENVTHFSRVFKDRVGFTLPNSKRKWAEKNDAASFIRTNYETILIKGRFLSAWTNPDVSAPSVVPMGSAVLSEIYAYNRKAIGIVVWKRQERERVSV